MIVLLSISIYESLPSYIAEEYEDLVLEKIRNIWKESKIMKKKTKRNYWNEKIKAWCKSFKMKIM